MDSARWDRIQDIFHRVANLPPAEQQRRLDLECAGDESLAAELRGMLDQDARAASMLEGDVAQSLPEHAAVPFAAGEFGPYRISGTLGEGGMGVVYLAEREDIGSKVAIKLLKGGALSPLLRKRFADEQKTLAQLQHPSIAQIHDADALTDGTPWFVMEYVNGQPITAYCRERNATIEERLRLFRSVCEAVRYAHAHTIIHLDLKPSNIFVKADGEVKLLDFGIAKQLEARQEGAEVTATALRPMTLPYAAPEQIAGGPLGTWTDVYSLGVTLYELLTGKLPFDLAQSGRLEAERRILTEEPKPPSAAGARAHATGKAMWSDLDVLCLAAMRKDPQRRYGSAEALLRDIDHYLDGQPLEARPDTLGYRTSKFLRRNARALSITAATLALFVGLAAFFVVRLAKARNAAQAEATRTHRIEQFMLSLFDGGDKSAGPSDDLRATTLVDRGAQNARTLNAEPAVQAELYQTLGTIYQKLGKLDQADTLLRASLDKRQAVAGADSADAAAGLIDQGLLRLDQGNVKEAERLVRAGVAMNARHLQAADPARDRGESALGRVLQEKGAYDEAVRTLDPVVRAQSENPEGKADLAESLRALGASHFLLGHLTTADDLYRRGMAIDRELYGANHPRVADDWFSLGEVQHDLHHDAEAEQDYRRSLAINQAFYGKAHPNTALSMEAVAQALTYEGRLDEAAQLLREALAIQEQALGKNHPLVAQGLGVLGVFELRRGHLSEAEADFSRMADIERAVNGDRSHLVGVALMNLGEVYIAEKRWDLAEHFYGEAVSRFSEVLPAGHSTTATAQCRLGHALAMEKKYREAEGPLLAGHDVLVKQTATRIDTDRKDLVTVYQALHEPDRAAKFQAELDADPPKTAVGKR